jgi:RNA polymerase sigma factor (TIGR02999 family)
VSHTPGEVTRLLFELKKGNKEAEAHLIVMVYDELRRIAAAKLSKEARCNSIQPTALVHEAFLRLTRMEKIEWEDRAHFFAFSARLMRNLLVDHARARRAQKRWDGMEAVILDEGKLLSPTKSPEVLDLNDALDRLAVFDERQSRIVELRFFAGLSEDETAEALGISARTVRREWRVAKAWLYHELKPEPRPHQ